MALAIVGSITHEATLMIIHRGHKEKVTFEICDLRKANLIIGYTWLEKHNPKNQLEHWKNRIHMMSIRVQYGQA